MTNEIFNNWQRDAWTWMVATKGRKYITLKYLTIVQGDNKVTIKYNVSDEAELLATLNTPLCDIDAILSHGWGPKKVKVIIHEEIR